MFLYLSEHFGPTIQGEGPHMGKLTMFLRMQGCDQNCVWCDTKHAWKKADGLTISPKDLARQVIDDADQFNEMITITGGNPCIQDPEAMYELVEELRQHFKTIAVETQGTIWADWLRLCDIIVISPKPPSSRMAPSEDVLRQFVREFQRQGAAFNLALKMVVFDKYDYEYAKSLTKGIFLNIPCYLQPGNGDVHSLNNTDGLKVVLLQQLQVLMSIVMDDPEMQHVTVLPQLHVLLWGNQRGV